MSSLSLSRRQFLTLSITLLLPRAVGAAGDVGRRTARLSVETAILYGALRLRLDGTIDESVDRRAGRYTVTIAGTGTDIATRIVSEARWAAGCWQPVHTVSWFQVHGRESRSDVTYDHARHTVSYHFRGETFFLRRPRIVDDTFAIPDGTRVDDAISAMFNYADDCWRPDDDGCYRTQIVRRHRRQGEGPDDVDERPHAELAPLVLTIAPDATTGKPTARFDMSGFSSWARPGRPAEVVFGPNRRPELITSSLMLGTSITIRFQET